MRRTMKAIFEVQNGARAGHRIWLRNREFVRVGRSEWSDFSIEFDSAMSDVHFALIADVTGCQIRDLGSEHGTFVNQQPVTETMLNHGDRIQAGGTQFLVKVHQRAHEAAAPRQPNGWRFREIESASELLGYEPESAEPNAPQLADQIGKNTPMYLIVQPAALPAPVRSEVSDCTDFVIQSDDSESSKFTPLLISKAECPGAVEHAMQQWNQCEMIALFSKLPKLQLLNQLRQNSASFSTADILKTQINSCPREFVQPMFSRIAAVLLPMSDSWRLFGNPLVIQSPADLGIKLAGQDFVNGSGMPPIEVVSPNQIEKQIVANA